MTVIVENEYEFDFDVLSLLEILVKAVLEDTELKSEVELNIVITDNEEIHRVNKEFRQIDKETDVLSFPALEFEKPADFSTIDMDDCSYYNSDTGELILGDMMLSYERVLAQAKEYNHSVKREFAFLVVHSLLHLLGYDHENKEDEIRMRERQTEILERLGIRR